MVYVKVFRGRVKMMVLAVMVSGGGWGPDLTLPQQSRGGRRTDS